MLANEYIEENNIDIIVRNLDKLTELSPEIAEILLENSYTKDVLAHLKNFRLWMSEGVKVMQILIEQGHILSVVDYLDMYKDYDHLIKNLTFDHAKILLDSDHDRVVKKILHSFPKKDRKKIAKLLHDRGRHKLSGAVSLVKSKDGGEEGGLALEGHAAEGALSNEDTEDI